MTDYNFGDIVLVPFPFTDQSTSKKRPAVVVSSFEYNKNRQDLVLMAVTSQSKSATVFGEVFVTHWEKAGLLKPSAIKPIFTTIEKKLVLKQLGQLLPDDQNQLRETINKLLS